MIVYAAVDLDMTIQELMTVPESDDWKYSMHEGQRSFSSAQFVVEALRELGVFTDLKTGKTPEFEASEFTCRDVYQLEIFDLDFKKPAQCDEADIRLEFCQLFGQYRLTLPGYGRVTPYDSMNEKCPNTFESGIHRTAKC